MPEKVRSIKNSPELIVRAGLGDGDWMHFSKLTARALIRPEIFELKVNVLGVMMLHAFGFGTELGVIMRRLKKYEDVKTSTTIVKLWSPQEEGPALLTEVMTSQSMATLLYKYGMEAYEEAGTAPSLDQVTALKQSRQNIRRVFETLEGDGLIERARLNCLPQDLAALGYEQAVGQGLLTPLSKLSELQRKQLGTGRKTKVGTFLLAKPRPAKTFGQRSSVVAHDYTGTNPNDSNAASAEQLFFAWGYEFGIDPELLKKHPELHKEMEKYVSIDRRVQQGEDARKRQELKMRGMAELIAREQGKPSITGRQKDFNFSTKSSLPAKPDKEQKASAPLNLTGKENSSAVRTDTSAPPSRRDAENIPLVSQPRSAEAYQILEVMRKYVARTDAKTAEELLQACRKHAPMCTVPQILAEIDEKGPKVPKTADYPAKYLASCVARMFDGGAPPERIQPAGVVPKCSECGRSVEGETVVGGLCGDCLAAHYENAPVAAAGD